MSYKVTDSTKNWKQWVSDFFHGRTHTFYGLMASFAACSTGVFLTHEFILQLLFFIGVVGSLGSAVDVASHLFYH